MSKMGKAAKQAATNVSRIRIVTHIPAQMASPGPPLGSQLGELGVNIASFIKDFNLKTNIFKAGVPIPCKITLNADRSHNLVMSHPPFEYFLKQAAGISRGAMKNEIVGMVTRKHVYEIAKLKSEDPLLQMIDLQEIVQRICVSARRVGIKIVDHLDPEEYDVFLKDASKVVEEQLAEIKAIKEAKLLRQ
uniref:Large ribosomal subunit protein uL11m n=1 Tax=Lepeophtheirus salmonis TaxID=72036 RepID=C1BSM4_LEPSM|nr:39S ribosomal protein L11, mitochondrial precursor [Lepeophtheirus salmonis]